MRRAGPQSCSPVPTIARSGRWRRSNPVAGWLRPRGLADPDGPIRTITHGLGRRSTLDVYTAPIWARCAARLNDVRRPIEQGHRHGDGDHHRRGDRPRDAHLVEHAVPGRVAEDGDDKRNSHGVADLQRHTVGRTCDREIGAFDAAYAGGSDHRVGEPHASADHVPPGNHSRTNSGWAPTRHAIQAMPAATMSEPGTATARSPYRLPKRPPIHDVNSDETANGISPSPACTMS